MGYRRLACVWMHLLSFHSWAEWSGWSCQFTARQRYRSQQALQRFSIASRAAGLRRSKRRCVSSDLRYPSMNSNTSYWSSVKYLDLANVIAPGSSGKADPALACRASPCSSDANRTCAGFAYRKASFCRGHYFISSTSLWTAAVYEISTTPECDCFFSTFDVTNCSYSTWFSTMKIGWPTCLDPPCGHPAFRRHWSSRSFGLDAQSDHQIDHSIHYASSINFFAFEYAHSISFCFDSYELWDHSILSDHLTVLYLHGLSIATIARCLCLHHKACPVSLYQWSRRTRSKPRQWLNTRCPTATRPPAQFSRFLSKLKA